jgi:hypothetical protein
MKYNVHKASGKLDNSIMSNAVLFCCDRPIQRPGQLFLINKCVSLGLINLGHADEFAWHVSVVHSQPYFYMKTKITANREQQNMFTVRRCGIGSTDSHFA